uniref:GPN-loop GTPase 2 n=1 Tax=Strigamia maritima TaxID=126957 RepID=T1JFR6_STRMM
MAFGQLVIGPPGSGKTTYCHGLKQFYNEIGRQTAIVNLDPANDSLPYDCAIDISQLITVRDVMESTDLGPNGALIYCVEFLEANFEWLESRLKQLKGHYFLFDCPGQVELYTHHQSIANIVERLQKLDVRLSAVHLIDSHYCVDVAKFVAILLACLTTMLNIGLPIVHVLSKIDLIEMDQKLHFNLDFYTDVLDLDYLLDYLPDDPFVAKYKKLNQLLAGVVRDSGLVHLVPLNIGDKEMVARVVKLVDRTNGYAFGSNEERNIGRLLSTAIGFDADYFSAANVQEKYVDNDSTME